MSDPTNHVNQILSEYGRATYDVVRGYLSSAAARDAVYHAAADYPSRGGRALRASYCIATARAFGGRSDDAVQSAASLELLHNSFLVRDDIEDESEERRGRPTLHRLHGVASAINVGDALTVLGLLPLLRNRARLGSALSFRILEEAEQMVRESVEGQALELRWRNENALDLTDNDYLSMTLKKTCWYTTIYPARVGALIGLGKVDPAHFIRFGFFLGAAFQIQDDVLNLIGDHQRYGKELDGDLLEGKRTLMLLHLNRRASRDERAKLSCVMALPRSARSHADVRWIRERMARYRSIEYAQRVAHALAGAATHEFREAFASAYDGPDKRFIAALPRWVLERT